MILADRNNIQENKQAAVDFLQLVIAGRIDQAYQKYVDMNGKHHNPWFEAGFVPLKKGMMENQAQAPHKQLVIKHVLGDGDTVAVHSHLIPNPGEIGMITLHLFRFAGSRIVEMWDLGQPIPTDSPNTDGAF